MLVEGDYAKGLLPWRGDRGRAARDTAEVGDLLFE